MREMPNGDRAHELTDCTNRFAIHGMINVIASDIKSHCTVRGKACRDCELNAATRTFGQAIIHQRDVRDSSVLIWSD
jgi:hypothetical protein